MFDMFGFGWGILEQNPLERSILLDPKLFDTNLSNQEIRGWPGASDQYVQMFIQFQ